MYEALQSSALAKSVLRQTKNRHVQSLSQSFRYFAASQLSESEVLGEAKRIVTAVVNHCNKYLGQTELKSKCLDAEHEKELEEEQEKELEEEQEKEVYRPPHCDPYNPQQPKWIDELLNNESVIDKSSGGGLEPLWKALKLTRVYSLSSDDDFDGRILASDNFSRTLE